MCSEDELLTEEETKELLTRKKWDFNRFEFKSSSSHNTTQTDLELEQAVNEFNENISIKFNSDNTGIQFFSGGTSIDFNWVKNQDTLNLDFINEPNLNTQYILNSIEENELNIYGDFGIYSSSINGSIFIDIYGNFLFN